MRKGLLIFIITIVLISLIPSCNLDTIDENSSINHNIFPYVKFTPSEDGTYYTASILEGASVANVYIPSYAYDKPQDENTLPVLEFTGFENSDDIVNLSSITFESSKTEINLTKLDQASILENIHLKEVDNSNAVWKNLPILPHTGDSEFVGWYIKDTDEEVKDGETKIDPEHTTIYAKRLKVEVVHHQEVPATCTESGIIEYWECKNCGLLFSDSECTNEITQTEISPLGHAAILVEEKPATCTENGVKAHYECTRCHKLFSDEGITEVTEDSLVIPHHTISEEWEYDIDNHWHVCTVDGTKINETSHTWGEWTKGDSGHLFAECSVCHVRKVANEPEYLVYDIGIGKAKLKDLEDMPCVDFYINNVRVDTNGAKITVDGSTVVAECRPYLGSNTNYTVNSYIVHQGIENLNGEKDSSGYYKVTFTLTDKSEYMLSISLGTESGSRSFECYLYKKN